MACPRGSTLVEDSGMDKGTRIELGVPIPLRGLYEATGFASDFQGRVVWTPNVGRGFNGIGSRVCTRRAKGSGVGCSHARAFLATVRSDGGVGSRWVRCSTSRGSCRC